MSSKSTQYTILQICLFILLIAAGIVSLCMGQYRIPPAKVLEILFSNIVTVEKTWTDTMYKVVVLNRLPRIVAAIVVGAALSLAGAAYQGVFRNPLVSPDLLGVSNGACVGAAISILMGLGYVGNVFFSFTGGLLAVTITVLFPVIVKQKSTMSLVLSGVIVGSFFSSILGLLKYVADPDTELAEITYWQLGSLARIKIDSLYMITPIIMVTGIAIFLLRWRINVISLGDKEAQTLGINLYRERGLIIACATLLTASSICISGTIGWIGLIMPHLARIIVGQDNKKVIPVSSLLSAIFLVVVDNISRNLTGAEIPIGIITGFVGTPFFAFVLVKQKSKV